MGTTGNSRSCSLSQDLDEPDARQAAGWVTKPAPGRDLPVHDNAPRLFTASATRRSQSGVTPQFRDGIRRTRLRNDLGSPYLGLTTPMTNRIRELLAPVGSRAGART